MTRATEFLLIDVGNTSVKLRRATAHRLVGKTLRLPTANLAPPDLIRALGRWRYRRIVLSSVAPAAAEVVSSTLPEPTLRVSFKASLGDVNFSGYRGAKTLGADRIANAVGAFARHAPGPMIIIDLGTAATFDAVDAGGHFLGGAIAPGLTLIAEALHTRTASLPPVRLVAPKRAVGRNTGEAMTAGVMHGFCGMAREILAAMRRELGDWKVVVTGGNARLLPEETLDPDLTMHGLRVIGASLHAAATRRGRKAVTAARNEPSAAPPAEE